MFYIGEVRDNKDPSGTGRVKVRFYNKHNNEKEIPDSGLPWAHPVLPTTAMTSGGRGFKPPAPGIGDRIICIYLEDDPYQLYPYYIGCAVRSEKAETNGIQQEDKETGSKSVNKENAGADFPGGKLK